MDTLSTITDAVSTMERHEVEALIEALSLPEPGPSASFGTSPAFILAHFTDQDGLLAVQRLSRDPRFDVAELADMLAACMPCDDQKTTIHNAMVLMEHFKDTGQKHGLDSKAFARAVSGLSHHNGKTGNTAMHKLTYPAEIAGAAAVVMFVGTMDRNGLVKLSKLKHPYSLGVSGLTIANRYLDQFLRANPSQLEAVCNYLRSNSIGKSRASVKPLLDYLSAGGVPALIDGLI